MAAAARVDPKDYFTDQEWARLNRRNTWAGPLLVAHCWLVIALAAAAGMVWPILIPLCVMVIGGRQLGLAILMHDAAHRALHPNAKVNDLLGQWLCNPVLHRYR